MRKIALVIALLAALFLFPYQAMATPKLEIDQPVFTFESVPEGEYITHEFILKNRGNTLLTIIKVSPP